MTSDGSNAMKWTGLWLLQIPVYLVTSYLIRTLMTIGYLSLIRIGADWPAHLLLEHFLWASLVGGFVAGLAGVLLFRAMLLLPIQLERSSSPAWTKPQAWTWVLPSCWLAFGMTAWLGSRGHGSVLEASHGSGLLATFFGSGCFPGSGDFHAIVLGSCMKQTTFTHPWLGTLGYSLSAFFPLGRFLWPASAQDSEGEQQIQITR